MGMMPGVTLPGFYPGLSMPLYAPMPGAMAPIMHVAPHMMPPQLQPGAPDTSPGKSPSAAMEEQNSYVQQLQSECWFLSNVASKCLKNDKLCLIRSVYE